MLPVRVAHNRICACVYVCTCIHEYLHIYIDISIFIYPYPYLYLYLYTHMYIAYLWCRPAATGIVVETGCETDGEIDCEAGGEK